MTMLAVPMTAMFLASEVIARTVDRRRGRGTPAYGLLDDDEQSTLPDVGGLDERDD